MSVEERLAHVEQLLAGIEGDPRAVEAVSAVVDLYGDALRRVLTFEPPRDLLEDELVSQLLLVHDLHPRPVEERVAEALDEVRPYLESHGGDVELLEVAEGVARVRLHGTCNGCPSSSATLRHAVEAAVERAAPEVEAVEAEGVAEPPRQQLVQITSLTCPTELQEA